MDGKMMDGITQVYADAWLLAVDKPAGLLVHGDGTGARTLTDLVREATGIACAQAVQRLDSETTGLVLFSYYNLIFSKGLEKFAAEVADAGIDAVLAVDLPLEEREELLQVLRPHGIGYIPLIAPNTPLERVEESEAGLENSFLYVITVMGITGARAELPRDLAGRLDKIRAVSNLPVAAGFGISTKAQAEEVCRHADGFIVGSALVKRLAEGKEPCLG